MDVKQPGLRQQKPHAANRPAAAEVGNAAQDSIGGMRVLVDNIALVAALPLAPEASVSVPILLHACTVRCGQAASGYAAGTPMSGYIWSL